MCRAHSCIDRDQWQQRDRRRGSKAPPDTGPGPDAAPASDATVIRLSLNEPERFAELFRRHAPRIQRYVTRRLGTDAADDIVAETFLLAFRRRAAYDQAREDALPWLARLTRAPSASRRCPRR
jgi:RNA polymerase sigma-70 factor (ECF subfamily)